MASPSGACVGRVLEQCSGERSWKRLGLRRRFAVLERCVRPIVMFKLQAFSPTQHWSKQVSKLPRHMSARCLRQRRLASELPKDFFQRAAASGFRHQQYLLANVRKQYTGV